MILGTGGFPRLGTLADAIRASGTEMVTVALRRIDPAPRGSLVDVLDEEVRQRKKPFLGICLGMQLLAGDSEEGGRHEGLGWLPASVRRLADGGGLKVPHIGWNDVRAAPDSPLFKGVRDPVFYFVHSYYVDCTDPQLVSATCDYGVTFPAAIVADNVWAVQFHPEKSQANGLRFLQNFLSRS